MGKKKGQKQGSNLIAQNRKARHEYHIEETFEAGVALAGWEVKSLRAGKGQLTDTYVLIRNGEAWLLNAQIVPLETTSTHHVVEPGRTRKLLIHKKEIAQIFSRTQDKGHSCVPLRLYWKKHIVKCEIALVVGKKMHDKRDTEKKRDWERQKARVMRENR
ncbi:MULTISPECIES: SsrA-binding protein SmpB [Carnimonas]|uniref:SsrA-binding protein SmpB n=1 Tax=Carnimonas TaxID=64322 RepID=UPI000472CD3F|nr:SsrA-binding protein SmpB [Carnimonas nigrificans]